MVSEAGKYFELHYERLVEELREWLRIPSISTLPEHGPDVRRAAEWVQEKLINIGFTDAELIETGSHPLVYAEYLQAEGKPTLLIYGHYDVQPVDPLAEWQSPPFEPQIRDGNIYARGATDDKGQVMVTLAALEAWFKGTGSLPLNVKVLLEGEEEAGGEAIDKYVRAKSDTLAADATLICDTHMHGPEQPSLVCGLRGILYTEIKVFGPVVDLHSGSYGGIAPNPIHALCLLISRLKGEDGVINIPGVQDAVEQVPKQEETFWHEDPLDIAASLKKGIGVDEFVGNNTLPPLERLGVRPTLEVHGIAGGFTGEGAKTVIPAEAVAKVSLRLPTCLDADEVFNWLQEAVAEKLPAGHRAEVTNIHSGKGISVDTKSVFIKAAADSLEKLYGNPPIFMREGGSIPIAALFDSMLQTPVVLMGFGLSDDGAHSPNEKFSLGQFRKGVLTVIDYLERIGK